MIIYPFYSIAATNEELIYYKNGSLYRFRRRDEKTYFICRIPMSAQRRILCHFRLFDRLFRIAPRTAILVDSKTLLFSMSGNIFRVDLSSGEIFEELRLRSGMNNPLSFAKIEGVRGFKDSIAFGEYFSNNGHEQVNVWQRDYDGNWRVVYSFPCNTIYHIHSIIPNKERGEVMILSGDSDSESGIWVAKNNFQEVTAVLKGSQKYRSCVAFPFKDGYVYATDTAREDNHLFFLHQKGNSWQLIDIARIPGPCIYGTKHSGKCYFSTSVEGDDTLSDMRYRFTYKLGKGVKSRHVHVICLSEEAEIIEVISWKKDWLPMLLFQFGNCIYPYSVGVGKELIMTPISVNQLDGKTVIL